MTIKHVTIGGAAVVTASLLLATPVLAQRDNRDDKTAGQPANAAAQRDASRVDLGTFEEAPSQYVGKTVTLEGEVARVLGPRLFTIDERNWIDLDGETLVLVPTPLAALVRSDDPVTITGTVQPYVQANVQSAVGWFTGDPSVFVQLSKRPVVVASSVTTVALGNALLDLNIGSGTAGGSSTTANAKTAADAKPAITDLAQVASATNADLVGRRVNFSGARVAQVTDKGFWIEQNGQSLFVLGPTGPNPRTVTAGQTITLHGVVLELPRQMKQQMGDRAHSETVYVQAQQIS